ncbi:MAG: hypothetical protein IIX97_03195 [Clostridia bacterium]|nr:hypothetical protein [Clostridia bacterium]
MQNIKNFDIKKYASLSMLTLTDDERRKAEADMQALLSIANGILSFDESCEICKSGGYHLDSLREDIPNESFNTADMLKNTAETCGDLISLSAKTVKTKKENGSED